MVSIVVDIVLLALIGISLANEALVTPQHDSDSMTHLSCSDFKSDSIILLNHQFLSVENPCIMKARYVLIMNNTFPSSQQAFNITGQTIRLIGNVFNGAEQDHYIVGDKILLSDNKYLGQMQVHELTGYEISLLHNVYIGNWQVHVTKGTSTVLGRNQYDAKSFDYIPMKFNHYALSKQYPNDLTYYGPEADNDGMIEFIPFENSSELNSTDKVPTGYRRRFATTIFSRSKIERPVDSLIFDKLVNVLNKLE